MSDSILAAIEQTNPRLREALLVTQRALAMTLERLDAYGSNVNEEHRDALTSVTSGLVMQMYGITASDWQPFKDYPDYQAFQLTTAYTAGRHVYPMPCGTGKSQSIISVICAVLQLEAEEAITYRPSLAIASYQIEANIKLLRQIQAELENIGIEVEPGLLAVSHSKDYDKAQADKYVSSNYLDYGALKGVKTLSVSGKKPITKHYDLASLPATPIEELTGCRFIFISHNRIKSPTQRKEFIEKYYTYQGAERSLLIWDEVLLPARHWYISSRALAVAQAQFHLLALQRQMTQPRIMVRDYLKEVWKKYERALKTITADSPTADFQLPPMSIDLEKAFRVFKKNLSDPTVAMNLGMVDNLPDLAGMRVRLTLATDSGTDTTAALAKLTEDNPSEQGHNLVGLMTASEQVPKQLTNIAILDASHPVSRLLEKDTTISTECYFKDEVEPGKLRSSFKTYENLTVHIHNNTSSEDRVRDLFNGGADRNNQAAHIRHELPRLIKSFGPTDAVLIVTFKDKDNKTSILKTIQKDLRAADIDLSEKLEGTNNKRINFLTWGMHTSMSELSFCNKIIIVGVQHKPVTSMYCEWLAQAGDDRWSTVGTEGSSPQQLVTGEVTSDLYQLINRGACRNTIRGSAQATDIYLQFSKGDSRADVLRGLRKLMPKMVVTVWKFKDTTRYVSQQDLLAQRVSDYLRTLPDGVEKISSAKLKKALNIGIAKDEQMLYTRAIDNLPDSCPWVREQRSLVYNPELIERLNTEKGNRFNFDDYFTND